MFYFNFFEEKKPSNANIITKKKRKLKNMELLPSMHQFLEVLEVQKQEL